ncbi:MAG: hypothetical protein JSS86_13555 [Cyanobacteria bacterium SZAS LIN-2]|nr:hypothetical protein [Cyanobacteria bacterium SZAS LIN-2]MBS2010365.1 hypothetical protein [Cyanobacteria bacterium SZAS TMP-1]
MSRPQLKDDLDAKKAIIFLGLIAVIGVIAAAVSNTGKSDHAAPQSVSSTVNVAR